MSNEYLQSVIKEFKYYRKLGLNAINQVPIEKLNWQYNDDSNSIATIVKHLSGNMLSRWTDFMTTDGEKEWRHRDSEFDNNLTTKEQVVDLWEKGWDCLFSALNNLSEKDLSSIVYIRNEGHTVLQAINRQLSHYPYHVGQIIYIAKMITGDKWKSLSVPKGKSEEFNKEKFAKEKQVKHFADE